MIRIFIIFIIILIIILNKKEYFSDNSEKFKCVDKKLMDKLINGVELLDKIFRKNNIYYSISFGTLLGAIRHGELIPWDDDIDLLIWRKDIDKIMSLNEEFKKNGWILEINWKLIKLYPFINNKKVEYPFIDLFIIDGYKDLDGNFKINRCLLEDGSKYIYKNECISLSKNHNWFHKWFHFDKKLLGKTKDYKLSSKKYGYNIVLKGPIEGIKLLKYWYGDDCLHMCKTQEINHITGKYQKSEIINCKELKSLFE